MKNPSDGADEDGFLPSKATQHALEVGGEAFQYSVLAKIRDAGFAGDAWLFHAAEFPVEVRGRATHIDFILSNPTREF